MIATGVSGILPEQFIRAFLRDGVILAASAFEPAQVQPASLDLRLGSVAYRVRASFLPGIEARVLDRLQYMDAYPCPASAGSLNVLEFPLALR